MNKSKKIVGLLIKGFLIIFTLIIIVMVIAPKLITLEMVSKNIRNTVSDKIGGEIKYRDLEVSYFPHPHVVIHQVEILIPDSFTIKIHRMLVYPKILPLFTGNLQIGLVTLEYADYFMKLPQRIENDSHPQQISSLDDILGGIFKAIRGLPEFKLPKLNLKIKYGKIDLVDPFGNRFKLAEVQAAYQRSPDKLDFSIRCKSNLWDKIDINGSLSPLSFEGKGHMELSRFRPQTLISYLLHDSDFKVTDTKANLSIDIDLDETGKLKAVFNGAFPLLALSRGKEQVTIQGGRVQGALKIDNKAVEISMTDLGLDYPRLAATGMFSYDETQRDIQLTVSGSRVEAASVRKVALALLGGSETVQDIFKIIRSGHVPWISVRTRGHKITELGMLDNIVIEGRMTEGTIFIPGAELNLDNVIGDALISGGVLHGDNLEARMGKSSGQDGKMILGLKNPLVPFHLKIGVNADLSQLPPVLGRVVEDQDFLHELALVDDIQGTASGTLILKNELANLKTEVEASNIHLTARYKRIPHPVKIEGGHFTYGGTRLVCENFNANIGKSSFVNPSIAVDWSGTPDLNFDSQSADFDLDQLYNWLRSFDALKRHIEDIGSLKGKVSVKNLKIKGPFFSPQDWRFQTSGAVNKLILTSEKLPKSLRIGRGRFEWQGTKIAFKDVDATLGKSSLQRVAGDVNWSKTPVFAVRSGPALFHLEDFDPLILSYGKVSAALDRFKSLEGTLAFKSVTAAGPLIKPSFGQTTFSAEVKQLTLHSKQLPGFIRVSTGEFSWRNNRLAMRKIEASLGKSTISQFSGGFDPAKSSLFEIQAPSAELFADEIFPWLLTFKQINPLLKNFSVAEGNFVVSNLKFKGPLHHPDQWQYDLTCKTNNLVLSSAAFGDPVTITSGSFNLIHGITREAAQAKITVKETDLTWGGNHLALTGEMIFTKDGTLLLDYMVTADSVNWDQINHLIEYVGKKNEGKSRRDRNGDLLGIVRVQAGRFTYEHYSVEPLEAELSFEPEKIVIAVNEAVVCSVSFQGLLEIYDQTIELYLAPVAVNQGLGPAASCISGQEDLADGTFNLSGQLLSKSKPNAFLSSLSGKATFSAEKGRIYRFGLLAKLLAILNVTEIYRGELPDLVGEGFAYRSMKISADLDGSKLIMKECAIDGVSMGLACEGNLDLAEKKMDLIILVAPFKTVDRIVKVLPLIKNILGGKLISIPFRAEGDLENPVVIPLHPTAVGSEVLGILERTLKLPITIIQPVFSLGKKDKSEQYPAEKQEPSGPP